MSDITNRNDVALLEGAGDSGLAFGATMLERLLLAIVKANPTDDGKTDQQRLNLAMKALVGQKASPNALPGDRDDRALLLMARERHCDKANHDIYLITRKLKPTKAISAPPKPRSDKALAELAVDHYFGISDESARLAVVNRLREKFSGSYQRKQGKGQDVDYPSTYRYRAVEHDYVQETLEAEALTRMCQELHEWGIPTKPQPY